MSLSCSSPDVDIVTFFASCHRAISVDVLQEFDAHVFYPLLLNRGQYVLSLCCVEGFLEVGERDVERDSILSILLLQLVYDVDVFCR